MEANWIDIFCATLLLILTGLGFYFGLAKTLIHLAAWIGGAVGVVYAPEFLNPFLADNFEFSGTTIVILSRALGFLLPFFVLRILGHFVNKFVKRHFSFPNALAGGIFGLVKGLIPCVILLSTLHLLPLAGELEQKRNSSIAYSIYTAILRKANVESGLAAVQDSIQNSIADKVNEAIDSSAARISNSAGKAIRNIVADSLAPDR